MRVLLRLFSQPVIKGDANVAAFLEALAISEFTQMFGSVVGCPPMTLAEVQHALACPLEARGVLEGMLCTLLGWLLSQWVSGMRPCLPAFNMRAVLCAACHDAMPMLRSLQPRVTFMCIRYCAAWAPFPLDPRVL